MGYTAYSADNHGLTIINGYHSGVVELFGWNKADTEDVIIYISLVDGASVPTTYHGRDVTINTDSIRLLGDQY